MDKQHFRIDRHYTRINTELPGKLGRPDADTYDVTILNLSAGGLKIACTRDVFMAIIPASQQTPGQISNVMVTVKFSLRSGKRRAVTIQADAMLVHSERLAQDNYHAGLRFIELNRTLTGKLEAWIEENRADQEPG